MLIGVLFRNALIRVPFVLLVLLVWERDAGGGRSSGVPCIECSRISVSFIFLISVPFRALSVFFLGMLISVLFRNAD
jgi:hypothetical protein